MRKILFFLFACTFWFSLTSGANGGKLSFGMRHDSPRPWQAEVFRLSAVREIPGAFYFKPAVSSKDYALFGYVSKVIPTPEELEAERRRISAIIDESVKQGYGSWENFEKEMGKAGEQAAQQESKEAPSWVKSLLPPSLIKEAVPLLMKGALLYAKTHPEASREPIGNVGETGIIIVDSWGEVTKIPLGINAPVESIAVSPDGEMAAVLTDMSFEDKNGRLHTLGEISFIDLRSKTRIYSRIFANLAGHLAFVPGTNWLAFDYYTDTKDFGKKDVMFFHFRTKQVLKYRFHTYGNSAALIYGKNVDYPNFIFSMTPTLPHMPIVALYNDGFFEIYDVMTGKKLLKVLTNGHTLVFAHNHPWVFTGVGEWWDYKNRQLLSSVKLPAGKSFPAIDAKFTIDDYNIIYVDPFGCPKRFDTKAKTVVKSCDFNSHAGLFFLTPDGRFIITFVEGKGMVTYKKHYLKRSKLCLRIIDTQFLRARQNICLKNSTVIDAALAGNMLVVSGFDKLYIYHYLFSPIAQTSENMYVQNPESMPGVFGSPEKNPFVFEGTIYYLRPGTSRLPDFSLLKPVGKIYTPTLNVLPRNFLEGFPGITNRFEWFAILYRGRIYIPKSGFYTFSLLSDDGSKLIIDGKVVIDNDGIHPPQEKIGTVYLREGIHEIEVPYFQGPRARVALVLSIIENNRKKVFDIRKYSVNFLR